MKTLGSEGFSRFGTPLYHCYTLVDAEEARELTRLRLAAGNKK